MVQPGIDRPSLFIDRPPLFIDRPPLFIDRPPLFIDRPSLFIDRPPLLSIARHYYRSPAIIIDRSATPIEPTTY
ncbi:hypothetical protein QUA82_35700 [Microcoleus sp. F8-D3]